MFGLHQILVLFSSLTITTGMYNVCNTVQSLDAYTAVGCLTLLNSKYGQIFSQPKNDTLFRDDGDIALRSEVENGFSNSTGGKVWLLFEAYLKLQPL
jgi:hypothetical protein